jgi:Tfp pilus assembly protein PilN
MTVLTADTSLIGTTKHTLPRVNLIPPEIAQQRQFRRVQMMLGAVGVGAVGVVGLLYLSATHSVSSAQHQLDQAAQQTTTINSQIHQFDGVVATRNAAAAAQAELVSVMGDEVRYSQMLADLSLAVPSNVWLKSLTFTQGGVAPAAGAPVSGAAPVALSGAAACQATNLIAGVQFTGVGFSHDDVASWLEALAKLKTYSNPYFSNSTESLIGPRTAVTFTSTANLTGLACSRHYLTPAGG